MSKAQEFSDLDLAIKKQLTMEDTVNRLKDELSIAKSLLEAQSTRETPLAMTLANVSQYILETGESVKCAFFISGLIDKEDPEPAYDVLKKFGEGSIIKWTVSLSFGKDEQEKAEKVVELLEEHKYEPEINLGVHHQSLIAALKRNFLRQGFPLSTVFKGFAGRKVKIKRPVKKST